MKPQFVYQSIVKPTLLLMAEMPEIAIPVSDKAAVLILAIAGQEGGWNHRRQIGGPARGYWQFERYGGVAEVMQKTPRQLKALCDAKDIPYDGAVIFEAMAWSDTLACVMARLLLFQDAAPLPEIGNKKAAWDYYQRNWRPGAPHPETWSLRYDEATAAMTTPVDPKQSSLKL